MKADPRRIHELEYELGFRDDPPPTLNGFLKAMWTDEPGAVIEYDSRYGRSTYDSSNPFARAALLARYKQPDRDQTERYAAFLKQIGTYKPPPWEAE